MTMKKYQLLDTYEGFCVVGYYDNTADMKIAAEKRVADTDGECLLERRRLNPKTNRYEVY